MADVLDGGGHQSDKDAGDPGNSESKIKFSVVPGLGTFSGSCSATTFGKTGRVLTTGTLKDGRVPFEVDSIIEGSAIVGKFTGSSTCKYWDEGRKVDVAFDDKQSMLFVVSQLTDTKTYAATPLTDMLAGLMGYTVDTIKVPAGVKVHSSVADAMVALRGMLGIDAVSQLDFTTTIPALTSSKEQTIAAKGDEAIYGALLAQLAIALKDNPQGLPQFMSEMRKTIGEGLRAPTPERGAQLIDRSWFHTLSDAVVAVKTGGQAMVGLTSATAAGVLTSVPTAKHLFDRTVVANPTPGVTLPSQPEPAFSALHAFGATSGTESKWGMVADDNGWLYGVTESDSAGGCGTIFKVKSDGTNHTTIYNASCAEDGRGDTPVGIPVLSRDQRTLYVMMREDGISNGVEANGTVFGIDVDGKNPQVIYSFVYSAKITSCFGATSCEDGYYPYGSLAIDTTTEPATLFGTARYTESAGGIIFSVRTDKTGYTVLHTFGKTLKSGSCDPFLGPSTCTDATGPTGSLVLKDKALYGTTSDDDGTVYRLSFERDGDGKYTSVAYKQIFDFGVDHALAPWSNATPNAPSCIVDKNDRTTRSCTQGNHIPKTGGLVLNGETLYGTAKRGGDRNVGIIYSIGLAQLNFLQLYSFGSHYDGQNNAVLLSSQCSHSGTLSCLDGTEPVGLSVDGESIYGVTHVGGNWSTLTASGGGYGTVFRFVPPTAPNTFEVAQAYHQIFAFDGSLDGANPSGAPLIYTAPGATTRTMYALTTSGGSNGEGTLFKISLDDTKTFTTLKHFGSSKPTWPVGAPSISTDGRTLYGTAIVGYFETRLFTVGVDGQNFATYGLASPESPFQIGSNLYFISSNRTGQPSLCRGDIARLASNDESDVKCHVCGMSGSTAFEIQRPMFDGKYIWANVASYKRTAALDHILRCDASKDPSESSTCTEIMIPSEAKLASPAGALAVGPSTGSSRTLFGVATLGGADGKGAIFSVTVPDANASSATFSTLWLFGSVLKDGECVETNKDHKCVDGVNPGAGVAAVTGSDGKTTLYGTTSYGGPLDADDDGLGTVFRYRVDGANSSYKQLRAFGGNGDGYYPIGEPVLAKGVLYSATAYGGQKGLGSIYRVKLADDSYARVLSSFSTDYGTADIVGANPSGPLVASADGTVLYGVTLYGGASGSSNGTVFAFKPGGYIAPEANGAGDSADGGAPGSTITADTGSSSASSSSSSSCSLGTPRSGKSGTAFAFGAGLAVAIGLRLSRRRAARA